MGKDRNTCGLMFGITAVVLLGLGSVNAEIETVTQGSLFTTRTWMRNNVAKSPEEFMEKVVNKGCSNKYTTTCLKLDVVSFVDRLSATEKYQIVPGLAIIKSNGSSKFPADMAATLAREHPNDIDARLDAFLIKRVAQYLDSHSLNFKLFDAESFAAARNFGEQTLGRKGGGIGGLGGGGGGGFGGGKDKGGGGMIMAAGAMMASTLGAVGMGAIAALAAKALMTGLLSLMLSAIVGLKSLGGSKGVHYEIIQKPVYSHSHSHSSEVQHVDHHGHGGGGGGGGGHGGGGGGGGGSHDYGHSSYGRSFVVEDPVDEHRIIPLAGSLRGGKQLEGALFEADARQNVGGQDMAFNSYAPQN